MLRARLGEIREIYFAQKDKKNVKSQDGDERQHTYDQEDEL